MHRVKRTIGNRMLNTSPKLRTYTSIPSNLCFTGVLRYLVSRMASRLDAFSTYPYKA